MIVAFMLRNLLDKEFDSCDSTYERRNTISIDQRSTEAWLLLYSFKFKVQEVQNLKFNFMCYTAKYVRQKAPA